MKPELVEPPVRTCRASVILAGRESCRKLSLAAALSGKSGNGTIFRGSTVACEIYQDAIFDWIDPSGILGAADMAPTTPITKIGHRTTRIDQFTNT